MRDNSREITRFFQRLESDSDFDPESYLKQYPELESEIKQFFFKLGGLPEVKGISESEPRILGDFKILKEIGSGGMATVYEAEQLSLKRKVALKLLPSHMSLSDRSILKFQQEAEAGGRQSHPGIVGVYAVGEIEKIHYIAQELVQGCHSLEKELKNLREQRERPPGHYRKAANIIAKVADALNHAHTSGVVHRDVKPSNILLTLDGQPKLTDFGLACVEDALKLSRTGEFSGTPYYMSPEQASGKRERMDHRTDVYSLGVTLYEMLTLKRPFVGSSTHGVLKCVVEHEPDDPRKIDPQIPRDLAVICLKAMEKDLKARYQTMVEFASDLRRFLHGEVIQAKPAGAFDRLMKRVKRNPALSAAAGVAVTALLCLFIYVLWSYPIMMSERNEAIEARNESELQRQLALEAKAALEAERNKAIAAKELAESESAKASVITEFMNRIMSSPEPGKEGIEVKVVDVLDRAAREAGDNFGDEPEVEAALRKTLGQSYFLLGQYESSFEQYQIAYDRFKETFGKEDPITMQVMKNLAMLLTEMGKYDESDEMTEKVLAAQREILGDDHPDTLRTLNNMGLLRRSQGRLEEAESLLRTAWEGRKKHHGPEDAKTMETQANLATVLRVREKTDEAIPLLKEVHERFKVLYGENDTRSVGIMTGLALSLQDKGRLDEAIVLLEKILENHRENLGEEHADTLKAMCNLAGSYAKLERNEEAESMCAQAVNAFKKVYGEGHPVTLSAMTNWAGMKQDLGLLDEAETLLHTAQEGLARTLGEHHPNVLITRHSLILLRMDQGKAAEVETIARSNVASGRKVLGDGHSNTLAFMGTLANVLSAQGKYAEAETQMRETLSVCKESLGTAHPTTIKTMNNLGYMVMEQGRLDEADALFRDGIACAEEHLSDEHPETALLRVNHGECLSRLKRYAPAETSLLEGYERLKALLGERDDQTRKALLKVVDLYASWGKPEEERVYREQLTNLEEIDE